MHDATKMKKLNNKCFAAQIKFFEPGICVACDFCVHGFIFCLLGLSPSYVASLVGGLWIDIRRGRLSVFGVLSPSLSLC